MADTASPVGVPYKATPDQPVDEWSALIYDHLKGWAEERCGQWTYWTPGYLVLTVNQMDGAIIDPVILHTWEDELTVELRHWDTHLPDWNSPSENPASIVAEAISVAEDWLAQRMGLAVYFAGDRWCGSRTFGTDPESKSKISDIEWIKDFGPERVELRWANRLEHFVISDGQLVSP